MSTRGRKEGKSRLRALAKQVLERSEYVLLRNAWVAFAKTKSVGTLCSELIGLLDTPEKLTLLAEVKLLLPESLHSQFLQQCQHYQAISLQQKFNKAAPKKNSKEAKRNKDKIAKERKRTAFRENKVPNNQENVKYESAQARLKSDNGKKDQERRKKTGSVSVAKSGRAEERQASKRCTKDGERTVVLSRVKDQDVGIRLVGEVRSVGGMVIRKVIRNSLADMHGIHVGDKINRVNGLFPNRASAQEIVQLLKTAKTLHLKIQSEDFAGRRRQAGATMATMFPDGGGVREVTVLADESGWLGCSIRGGGDYGCDVRVISVKNESPAWKAGLKKGDIIVKVNNQHTAGLTHVQVVRLIVTAAPPVTFTVTAAGKPSNQMVHDGDATHDGCSQPTTPLRLRRTGNAIQTPPNSPPYPRSCPPSYSSQLQEQTIHRYNHGSPSHLAVHAIDLNQTPPPPYTSELPSTHRRLADRACLKELPLQSAGIGLQSSTLISTLPLPPFPSPLPSSPSMLCSTLPPPPSSAFVGGIGDFCQGDHPEEGYGGKECHVLDDRQSLLSQIRAFQKSSLKGVSEVAMIGARKYTEDIGGTACKHDNLCSQGDTASYDGGQQGSDGLDFMAMFHQALQDRARVLNTTFDDESGESDSDWEV